MTNIRIIIAGVICMSMLQVQAQCSFTLGPDKYYCQGQSINTILNGPSAFTSIIWNTGSTSQNISVNASGTYICTATQLSGDLVVNGNFSAGNTGFTTNYTAGSGGSWGLLTNPGTYEITSNGNLVHSNFYTFGDHTNSSGNMMVCNGSAVANDIVWSQTIAVTPNTNYNFSAWVASMENLSSITQAAQLQFSINGSLIGPIFYAPLLAGQWSNFYVNWNSGSNTSALITIVDQNAIDLGSNDFALDDIFFQQICVSKDTLDVKVIPLPDISTTTPAQLNCSNTSVSIGASSATTGVGYSWTGSGGFVSSQQNHLVSTPGTYSVTVTEPIHNCTSTTTVTVQQNIIPPANVSASNSGILTCASTSVNLNGSSSTNGVSYVWTGPGGFSSAVQNPTGITTPGIYTLTVTNNVNHCTTTSTTTVVESIIPPANVSAGSTATLNCAVTSIGLIGSSSAANVGYSWIGPNGFSSSNQNPTGVSSPGMYTLVVTNPLNGCSDTAVTLVTQNISPPLNVSAASTNTLTCSTTTVGLIASSSTSNVSYNWSGPGSFTSPLQNPIGITIPGTYTLTVTDPVNNCTSTTTATVLQNNTAPGGIISPPEILTCLVNSIGFTISFSSASNNYSWVGPAGYSSLLQNPTGISIPGTSTLTVTDPSNNCSSTATVVVTQDIAPPSGVSAGNSGPLTCNTTDIALYGSCTTPGVVYSWNGPNAFSSSVQNPTGITTPGNYSLTVSNPLNGCTSTVNTVLLQNISPPAGVTANASNIITCLVTSASLTGVSTTGTVSYTWNGPSAYTSSQQNPTGITTPGIYNLVVTNTTNGCTDTAAVTVMQNMLLPDAHAGADQLLPCSATFLSLNGVSSTVNPQFNWSGPNSFSASTSSITINTAGSYILSVTNPVNGCIAHDTVQVQSMGAPVASFSSGSSSGYGSLTVDFNNTSINATSVSWIFGDGTTAGNVNSVSNTYAPGTYTVLLIASNGTSACNDTTNLLVEVLQEPSIVIPNIFTPNGDNINDVFAIRTIAIKEVTVAIYNRWGQIIATLDGYGSSWDGKDTSDGTYMYLARAVGEDGKEITRQGSLLLVR